MDDLGVPAWCRREPGRRAVLIVAPHGGRRGPGVVPANAGVKVNDLHTAELATEMAAALDASYVINPCWDRNELDLNRVSQVAERAVWFLRLLEDLLADLLQRHARAEVLFVHGWNISQPKCDIGIGRRLRTAVEAADHAGELTVSPDYLAGRLTDLHAACAARGIVAVFGERYAGRHPNNVLQLFRRTPQAHGVAPRLAAWAAAGRIDAVQLELGVPVRWPGRLRGTFVEAVAQCFGDRPTAAEPSRTEPPPPIDVRSSIALPGPRAAVPAVASPGYALQCHDPAADIAVVVRVEPAADGTRISARVLLFVGRQQVGLFTGEEPSAAAMGSWGPHVDPTADGFRLRFDGALLITDDGDRYVDLESAFAASQLAAVRLDLRFRSGTVPGLGSVRGLIAIDESEQPIDALGFSRPVILQRDTGGWRSQLTLNAAFGPDLALRVRHVVPGTHALLHELATPGTARPLETVAVHFHGARDAPVRIVVRGPADDIVALPLSRVTIIRAGGPHHRARITFGAARFTRAGREGFGFYEYARTI